MAIIDLSRACQHGDQVSGSFQPGVKDADVRSWSTRVLLFLVRLYQLTLSPLIGGQCRFYPSCSHYAQDSLRTHGAWRGSSLAFLRLIRCHPFSDGGIDEVPLAATAPKSGPQEHTHLVNRNR